MVKTIKRICYKAIEWQMLRVYAIIMTGIFLSLWVPAMVSVVYQMLQIYGVI